MLSGPTCRLVWLPCAQEFFLLLLFLSLSNAIENVSGGALGDKVNPFNIATICNLRALTPSYGVMEFVIVSAATLARTARRCRHPRTTHRGVHPLQPPITPARGQGLFCVRFMYQMRAFLASEAQRIDYAHLTSADFCVQVRNGPGRGAAVTSLSLPLLP